MPVTGVRVRVPPSAPSLHSLLTRGLFFVLSAWCLVLSACVWCLVLGAWCLVLVFGGDDQFFLFADFRGAGDVDGQATIEIHAGVIHAGADGHGSGCKLLYLLHSDIVFS